MSLTTSPHGQNVAYRIEDNDVSNTSYFKKYRVIPIPTDVCSGYTKVEINKLKIHITDKFKEKIKYGLISTYRPLLENREVEMFIDDERLDVSPLPLDEDYNIERGKFVVSNDKEIKY